MKIIFAGTTSNAAEILAYLCEQGRHEIAAVLSREDAPTGRKQVLTASAVSVYAQNHGLRLIKTNRIDAETLSQLATLNADLGFVVAYGALLDQESLELPKLGWINVHYSLLPAWRGAAPVQRSLMAGDRETGVTIFRLELGMDTGPIFSQVATTIEPDENAGELLDRLTKLSITMLDETLSKIESETFKPIAQQGAASVAKKISRQEAKIDWRQDAETIEHLVRGANPEPMAYTTLSGESFRIISARAHNKVDATTAIAPGAVVGADNRVLVRCANGALELIQVQPASKNVMNAADWFRGVSKAVLFE